MGMTNFRASLRKRYSALTGERDDLHLRIERVKQDIVRLDEMEARIPELEKLIEAAAMLLKDNDPEWDAEETPALKPWTHHIPVPFGQCGRRGLRIARMSEEEAIDVFVALRYTETDGEPFCPQCGCKVVYRVNRTIRNRRTGEVTGRSRKYTCAECTHQFSPTSGTIFHGRKLEHRDILFGIALWINGAKGKRINHDGNDVKNYGEAAYSRDGISTNWAESAHSRIKRSQMGVHHHIAGKYLEGYADEMTWREDMRRMSNGEQFLQLVTAGLHHPRSKRMVGKWRGRAKKCAIRSGPKERMEKCGRFYRESLCLRLSRPRSNMGLKIAEIDNLIGDDQGAALIAVQLEYRDLHATGSGPCSGAAQRLAPVDGDRSAVFCIERSHHIARRVTASDQLYSNCSASRGFDEAVELRAGNAGLAADNSLSIKRGERENSFHLGQRHTYPTRDVWYRENLPMSDMAVEQGLYLKTLTKRESIAHMATTVMEYLMVKGRYQEAITVGYAILDSYPRDGYTMVKMGTAAGEIMQRDFVQKYPRGSQWPLGEAAKFQHWQELNELTFRKATRLGWEQPSEIRTNKAP